MLTKDKKSLSSAEETLGKETQCLSCGGKLKKIVQYRHTQYGNTEDEQGNLLKEFCSKPYPETKQQDKSILEEFQRKQKEAVEGLMKDINNFWLEHIDSFNRTAPKDKNLPTTIGLVQGSFNKLLQIYWEEQKALVKKHFGDVLSEVSSQESSDKKRSRKISDKNVEEKKRDK